MYVEEQRGVVVTYSTRVRAEFSRSDSTSMRSVLSTTIGGKVRTIYVASRLSGSFPRAPSFPTNTFVFSLSRCFDELARLGARCRGGLRIQVNMRVKLRPRLKRCCGRLARGCPFSFIVNSVRLLRKRSPCCHKFFRKQDSRRTCRRTFRIAVRGLGGVSSFSDLKRLSCIIHCNTRRTRRCSCEGCTRRVSRVLGRLVDRKGKLRVGVTKVGCKLKFPGPRPSIVEECGRLNNRVIAVKTSTREPRRMTFSCRRTKRVLTNYNFDCCTRFGKQGPIFEEVIPWG